jgi:hypothetical protein
MEDVRKFLEESPIASTVSLLSAVIAHRQKLNPADIGRIMEAKSFSPSGEDVCELEVGGRLVARGKMIRRRGKMYFKVTETAKGEAE